MKTAEEWTKIEPLIFSFIDNINPQRQILYGNEDLTTLIKQIQLDAWKQGMSDAAKIVDDNGAMSPAHFKQNVLDIQQYRDESNPFSNSFK